LPGPLFSELVPPPASGRIFIQSIRPSLGDCAPSGRIRLDGIARCLQDVAYSDVEEAGLADSAVWVVRRTRINVRRFPRFAEHLAVRTFCSGLGRMWAERRTTIALEGSSDNDVEAVSLWVHLDPASWRPTPFSDEEIAVYGAAAGGRRVTARLRHPLPAEATRSVRWGFRLTDCDLAGHINNASYWQPLEEELLLGGEDPRSLDAEIEYRNPSQSGEKVVLCDGEWRWILSEAGETHASIRIRGDLSASGRR
jgi:acyl-ACP thioesterase